MSNDMIMLKTFLSDNLDTLAAFYHNDYFDRHNCYANHAYYMLEECYNSNTMETEYKIFIFLCIRKLDSIKIGSLWITCPTHYSPDALHIISQLKTILNVKEKKQLRP